MSGIRVIVQAPTPGGRLYPRYIEDIGFLVLRSPVERDWPYGFNVSGAMVFDLDEDRVLANFDFHIPKRRWVRDLPEGMAAIASPGDLAFTEETILHKTFDLPLRARTDRATQCVRIEFGSKQPDRQIALSESCIALLAKDELVGFFVKNFS
jgi:hypothetical protein